MSEPYAWKRSACCHTFEMRGCETLECLWVCKSLGQVISVQYAVDVCVIIIFLSIYRWIVSSPRNSSVRLLRVCFKNRKWMWFVHSYIMCLIQYTDLLRPPPPAPSPQALLTCQCTMIPFYMHLHFCFTFTFIIFLWLVCKANIFNIDNAFKKSSKHFFLMATSQKCIPSSGFNVQVCKPSCTQGNGGKHSNA